MVDVQGDAREIWLRDLFGLVHPFSHRLRAVFQPAFSGEFTLLLSVLGGIFESLAIDFQFNLDFWRGAMGLHVPGSSQF